MTRSELIQVISSHKNQLSYKETEAAVKCVFDQMAKALGRGDRIEIRGFGSFSVRFRPPRMARNPKSGAYVHKEGKYSLRFKPGKEMRESVNLSAEQYPIVDEEKESES